MNTAKIPVFWNPQILAEVDLTHRYLVNANVPYKSSFANQSQTDQSQIIDEDTPSFLKTFLKI